MTEQRRIYSAQERADEIRHTLERVNQLVQLLVENKDSEHALTIYVAIRHDLDRAKMEASLIPEQPTAQFSIPQPAPRPEAQHG